MSHQNFMKGLWVSYYNSVQQNNKTTSPFFMLTLREQAVTRLTSSCDLIFKSVECNAQHGNPLSLLIVDMKVTESFGLRKCLE